MRRFTTRVLLPAGLISNYEYTVSFWINPTVITPFTTAFFGAVDEQTDASGVPFSNSWLSFVPQSWGGNTMLWSGSDAWFDGSAGERIEENTWTHVAFSVNRGVVSVYLDGRSTTKPFAWRTCSLYMPKGQARKSTKCVIHLLGPPCGIEECIE